ncbi:hypothetical protein [Methylacidimicrobium sp. B4]|uniref:hypothetical protein n=1 Tax=Methylacidimicrobium sp. B4 TaxID=2796139 RepID=UPI001A8FD6D0|nr:hypothetical protein [Methylacidimicrobium sp. B4]QSR84567.1 hypothetical protein MacB4_10275 [Methylacidimicrobium sp. B4]
MEGNWQQWVALLLVGASLLYVARDLVRGMRRRKNCCGSCSPAQPAEKPGSEKA